MGRKQKYFGRPVGEKQFLIAQRSGPTGNTQSQAYMFQLKFSVEMVTEIAVKIFTSKMHQLLTESDTQMTAVSKNTFSPEVFFCFQTWSTTPGSIKLPFLGINKLKIKKGQCSLI